MNRTDLQQLCDLRVQESLALLKQGLPAGAYYLLGYAVECALKACIAKQVREHDFPDLKLVRESYTHDLVALRKLAGLEGEFNLEVARHPELGLNWTIVKDWNEQVRYELSAASTVQDFFSAVLDPNHGVLPWLKKWW